ncbi:MAG: [Fe-Fe] hydrogenase large subunit C-terminal domain-containing protein [Eubacterium sp.]
MSEFKHSVRLDENLCMGCINCIKRCPTQAIRVRNGKAVIINKFCIDCGECIRICPHHAKKATYDKSDIMDKFEYTVALPAPSLYGQFNNLDDINIVLTGLKLLGFDDVFEVAGAAEIVSQLSREYIANNKDKYPIISSACPSVVRLIKVRFPNLIEHLMPMMAPIEVAAKLARKRAMERTGLPSEKIGIIFISPCPAKVTSIKLPLGVSTCDVDGVMAIKDIYPKLISKMEDAVDRVEDLAIAGKIGVSWGSSGGEAGGLITDNYLAADGIENVIRILEELEDQKLENLEFIELNACSGGCVGGVLTVENPYVAKVKLKRLRKYLPVSCSHIEKVDVQKSELMWDRPIDFENVFSLGDNIFENMQKFAQIDELCNKFPGLDCGACGAPTCRALAEDIVRGNADEKYCVYILRELYEEVSNED